MASFATFYARALERALTRGIPRRYREEEEWLAGVRGRILVAQHARSGGLPLPVPCQFDDHTLDNQLNRLLAAAARRLAKLPRTSDTTRRSLLRALGVFDGVGQPTAADLNRATWFDRTTEHLRPTERLARLALRSASLEHDVGMTSAATFLIDMNGVYERFVEDRLRRALRGQLSVIGQHRTTLDLDKRVRMRPDLLFRHEGRAVYVADAKYKLTASGVGRESDYYQLLAYCTALALPEGLLVYCHHEGEAPASVVTVRGDAGIRLRVAAVRLDGSPAEIDSRLEALACEVLAWATPLPV
jgi:5-methylcytosine-specific restriction enzyme subunit McrC